MKKEIFKLIVWMICIIFTLSFSFALAVGDSDLENSAETEEIVIKDLSEKVLDIMLWFGYAIALGILVFIGIKYMMSSANEKANLKQLAPMFLIGLAVIVFCFSIAKYVANLAGNDEAKEIIQVGEDAGGIFSGKP